MDEPVTLLRDGNHFICWDKRWILIDGPWHKYLTDRLGQYMNPVRLEYTEYSSMLKANPNINDLPEYYEPHYVVWYPVRWHPGSYISMHNPILQGVGSWKWFQYRQWNSKRAKVGWTCGTNAVLPCYINRVEFIPDEYEVLLQQDIYPGSRRMR